MSASSVAIASAVNPFWAASNVELKASAEQIAEVLEFRSWLARGMAAGQQSLFEAPAVKPAPAPAKKAEPALIPEVLSPSSVNKFAYGCQVKWFYSKVLRLPEVRGAALGLGSAVHDAIVCNFRNKLVEGSDLPAADVQSLFRDCLKEQLDTVTLTADDDVDDLKLCGEIMVGLYMERVAPSIMPAALEHRVEGLVGDVPVCGYIDILDTAGRVIDIKTASKKPAGVPAPYRNQVTTYAMLEPAASGVACVSTLTKTKTVALHESTFEVSDSDRKLTERLYSIAREQMRSGVYLPNRDSYTCSRTYCSHCGAVRSLSMGGR
jgi:hypothetical protein